MLILPPAVEQALAQSVINPFLYGEIITDVQDDEVTRYGEWSTQTEAQHRSYIGNLDRRTTPVTGEFGMLQLLYHAQSGDPTQTFAAVEISTSSVDTVLDAGSVYQTFHLPVGEVPFYEVTTVRLKLRRDNTVVGARRDLRLRISDFEAPPGPGVVQGAPRIVVGVVVSPGGTPTPASQNGLSQPVNPVAFLGAFTEITFTFAPALKLFRGVRYVAFLYGATMGVQWGGYAGRRFAPGEQSGTLEQNGDARSGQFTLIPVEGQELSLRIGVPCFSFDGTTLNYRDIEFDVGSPPTVPGWWEFDYATPANTRIRFKAWGSTTGAWGGEEVGLGATDNHTMADDRHAGTDAHVHDGDVIPVTQLYRYYKIRAELLGTDTFSEWAGSTPTNQLGPYLTHTPTVFRMTPAFPTASGVLRITSKTVPGLDALPCISEAPSLSYGMDLVNPFPAARTMDLSLVDLGGMVSTFLMRSALLNATVSLWIGFLGSTPITSTAQMVPAFRGRAGGGPRRQGDLITLPLEDRSLEFDIRLPRESGLDEQSRPYFEVVGEHMVDVMDRVIYTEARVRRSGRHRDGWVAAKAAVGADWLTTRLFREPTSGREIVADLLEHTGTYPSVTEDGQVTLIRYPRSENPVGEWTDADFLDEPVQGDFASSIINEYVVYSQYAGDGKVSGEEVYGSRRVAEDKESQRAFMPGSGLFIKQKQTKSMWIAGGRGPDLGQVLADRFVATFARGVAPITVPTPWSKYKYQVGDIITIRTRSYLRQFANGTGGLSELAASFMLTNKRPNYDGTRIDWTMVEARDFNPPPVPVLAVDPAVITAPAAVEFDAGGSNDLDVGGTPGNIVLAEYDPDYDGTQFQAEATLTETDLTPVTWNYPSGSSGRKLVAVRLTDERGKTAIGTAIVRIRTAPVVEIRIEEPKTSSEAMVYLLSAAYSYSPSAAALDLFEWDLSYDPNAGFVQDAVGVTVRLTTHFQSVRIACRVTDSDSLSATVYQVVSGKDLLPARVAGISVIQRDYWIEVAFPPSLEHDLAAYVTGLRVAGIPGGTADAAALHPEILVGMFRVPLIRPYTQTFTFAVRAIDTSGNQSQEERAMSITPRDPGGRTQIVATLEDTVGWTGEACGLACDHESDAKFLHDLGVIEDISAYGEVDAGSHLLKVDTDRVEFTSLTRQVNSYLYRDKGAGYFDAECHFDFMFRVSAISTDGCVAVWGLGLGLGSIVTQEGLGASGKYIALEVIESGGTVSLRLREWTGSVANISTAYTITAGTTYHVRVGRTEQTGSAVFRFEVYGNAQRTTLLSSQSLTMASLENYRYLYALIAKNDGTAGTTVSGWTGKLWFDKAGTVQATSAFTEVDPNSRLSASGHRFSFTGITRQENAYFYWDRGINYYDRDFSLSFMVEITAATSSGGNSGEISTIILSNTQPASALDDEYVRVRVVANSGGGVGIDLVGRSDYDDVEVSTRSFVGATNTKYFCRFARTVSANGWAYYSLHVYKDAERSHLLRVVWLHQRMVSYRYLRVAVSTNDGTTGTSITGYVEQLWLTGLGRIMTGWYETATVDVGSASQLAWVHMVPNIETEIQDGVGVGPSFLQQYLPAFPEVETWVRAANAVTGMGSYTKRGLVVETVGEFVQVRVVSKLDSPGRPQALMDLSYAADRV